MANKNNNTPAVKSAKPMPLHRARTFFAALFGIIAFFLIFSSFIVVWLNRTLTDTTTYVNAVAPLVSKPAIQNFVAEKVTDQILKQGNPEDIASKLLTPAQTANQTPDQLTEQVRSAINQSVIQIVDSPAFAAQWRATNQSAHAALVKQLNNNATQLTLDLSPLITSVFNQLKTTQLSAIADSINIDANTGKLNIKGQNISKAHHYYHLFQEGTLLIVVVTLVMIGLSVWLSVHHAKTLRRIAFGSGIIALVLAALLEVPSLVKLNGADQITQNAARAIAVALVHNLQLFCLIFGIVCIAAAIGSKIYAKQRIRR